jgi:hypothetical protein
LAIVLFIIFAIVTSIRANEPSSESQPGFLKVYSATDAFNDGDAPYYAHSSYVIYTADRGFFKNVENHISRSDEIPETVELRAGRYFIEARSEAEGSVQIPIVVRPNRTTVINLEYPPKRRGTMRGRIRGQR